MSSGRHFCCGRTPLSPLLTPQIWQKHVSHSRANGKAGGQAHLGSDIGLAGLWAGSGGCRKLHGRGVEWRAAPSRTTGRQARLQVQQMLAPSWCPAMDAEGRACAGWHGQGGVHLDPASAGRNAQFTSGGLEDAVQTACSRHARLLGIINATILVADKCEGRTVRRLPPKYNSHLGLGGTGWPRWRPKQSFAQH
jgi:hypothetical protein